MKRASLFLAVLLCFTLLMGCSKKIPTAAELYSKSEELTANANDMDLSLTGSVSADAGGQSVTVDLDAHVMMTEFRTPENAEMLMDIGVTGTEQGVSMQISAYYADGWMYMEMLGMKFKQELPFEEAMAPAGEGLSTVDLNDALMEKAEVAESDGGYLVTVALSGDDLNDLPMQKILGMFESFSGDLPDAEFSSCNIEMTFSKDGLLTAQHVDAALSGADGSGSLDLDITVNGIDNITIPPPADLDSYTEM